MTTNDEGTKAHDRRLRPDVFRALWTYSTSLFVGDPPEYRGSATFVRVSGAACLLTAAHVWTEIQRHAVVRIATEEPHPLQLIPLNALTPRFVSVPTDSKWGPDLAIVSIGEAYEKALLEHKAFYRFDLERQLRPRTSVTLWALTGATGEGSRVHSSAAEMVHRTLTVRNARQYTHNGFEYVDIAYGPDSGGDLPPVFWGGLSGAGLWFCGVIWDGEHPDVRPLLSGVAFYQEGTAPREGVIRCHDAQGLDHALDGFV